MDDWAKLKRAAQIAGYRVTDDGLMVTFANPRDRLDQATFYQDAVRGACTALTAAQQWLEQRHIDVNNPQPRLRRNPGVVIISCICFILAGGWFILSLANWSLARKFVGIAVVVLIGVIVLESMILLRNVRARRNEAVITQKRGETTR
jgi:hypothetical protein